MPRTARAAATPLRSRPLLPALVAVAGFGVLVLVVAVILRDQDRSEPPEPTTMSTAPTTGPTTTTTAPADPVALDELLADPYPEAVPTSYAITYDIVENGLPREESRIVRRPYESLVVSTRDGDQTTGTATSLSALWTFLPDRGGWLAVEPERHRAAFDLRPLPALGPMRVLGLAVPDGSDEHAGRSCTVFVTGQPSSAAAVSSPSEDESTELCVDDHGLVLHERWSIGGRIVMERTARSVQIDVDVDAGVFQPTPVVEESEDFEAAFSSIAVEADAETLDRLRTEVPVPEGYAYDGAVLRAGRSTTGTSASTEIVRFYSSGPDLIEVAEQFHDGPTDLDGGRAVPVDIDGWEEVWFAPDLRASAVRARLTASSYVEVRGADPALLVRVVRSLVRTDP